MLGHQMIGGGFPAAQAKRAATFGKMPVEMAPIDLVLDDERCDDGRRFVTIGGGRVAIRRRVAGIAMRLSVPLSSYVGVAVKIDAIDDGALAVVLEHADPALCLTLARHDEADTLVAAWRHWAGTLDRPLISPTVPGIAAGTAKVSGPPRRRRRHGTVAQRRPRFLSRRRMGSLGIIQPVYAGEREIIARN